MVNKALFGSLFRKYRLRSEFETLSDFGDALADEHFIYETSIFSHWQKGSRVPRDRNVIFTLLKIFVKRKGITNIGEANEFMAASGFGYLTLEEISTISLQQSKPTPFQASRIIDSFVGREEIIHKAKQLLQKNKIVILSGQPGVGKTAIANKLAHSLRETFPDGVLWQSFETSSSLAILHAIMQSFGEVLPPNATVQQASDLYKSFISNKKILFIFDNVSTDTNLDLVLPNSSESAVLITTIHTSFDILKFGNHIKVEPFKEEEVQDLFESLFSEEFLSRSSKELQVLSKAVGHLPLALQLLSRQIAYNSISISFLMEELSKLTFIRDLTYENKSLASSLTYAYSKLDTELQTLLQTCTLFEGNNVSLDALSKVQKLPRAKVMVLLEKLISYSFIEKTTDSRFHIHPLIKIFLKQYNLDKKYIRRVADYYINLMRHNKNKDDYFVMMSMEVTSIIHIIRMCLQEKMYDRVFTLWELFGSYYWHVGAWRDFKDLSITIYELSKIEDKKELQLSICLEEVSRLYYYDGNIKAAMKRAEDALDIATNINDQNLIALAHQRYGKLCFMANRIEEGRDHLNISMEIYKHLNNYEHLSHNLRYESESYMLEKDYHKANNLLIQSLEKIDKIQNSSHKIIYRSVIYSHLGILNYLQGQYDEARSFFKLGLEYEKKFPLIRGTYTWLNKFGLAFVYNKLKYAEESKELMKVAKRQIQFLGIERSFPVINVYANYLSKEEFN